jgi:hypothetical protein
LVQCGAEGLIRIRHPFWRIVSPADYIPDDNDPDFRRLSGFLFDRVLDDWRYFVEHQGPVETIDQSTLRCSQGPERSSGIMQKDTGPPSV